MLVTSYLMLRPFDLENTNRRERALKRWFGYFLIVMGMYILAKPGPAALGLIS